jgi:curved DNA-binding protein
VARDYYEVLGVSRDATADQIQQAFRTLARKYHPDVNKDPAAEERFKEVNEAYHVLSDPDTRKRYDRFGEDFRKVPEDWEERVGAEAGGFRGAGPSGARMRYGQGFGGAGGINIEDLFGDMFGGSAGFGPIPGADQEAMLELTVEEAYRGGKRQISLDGRNYGVNIPPGVTDGQRIRLAGEGGRGSGDGPAGDLYLRVRIKPHPRFRLDGRDIIVDLPVSPWEAVLGTTVAVRTPGGEAKVKVPQGSSTGRRLRLRGEGMPNPRGTPGDLYAEIKARNATRRLRNTLRVASRHGAPAGRAWPSPLPAGCPRRSLVRAFRVGDGRPHPAIAGGPWTELCGDRAGA